MHAKDYFLALVLGLVIAQNAYDWIATPEMQQGLREAAEQASSLLRSGMARSSSAR